MSKFRTFDQILKAASKKKPVLVRIANVIARKDTQARTKTSASSIADYRAAYQGEPVRVEKGKTIYEPNPEALPPVVLCPAADAIDENPDGGPSERRYYAIDGDHRLTAAARADLEALPALIGPALTLDEARFAVLGANATHGLSRTNADKDNACRIACELAAPPVSARATKKKDGTYGKVSYTGKFSNGEKVTARALAAIAGVSHEKAAQFLKTTYAAQFANAKDDTKTEKPTGNAKDDSDTSSDPVDEIRDLTSTEPTEYAHSLIAGASQDVDWIAAVAETLQVWVDNQTGEAAA